MPPLFRVFPPQLWTNHLENQQSNSMSEPGRAFGATWSDAAIELVAIKASGAARIGTFKGFEAVVLILGLCETRAIRIRLSLWHPHEFFRAEALCFYGNLQVIEIKPRGRCLPVPRGHWPTAALDQLSTPGRIAHGSRSVSRTDMFLSHNITQPSTCRHLFTNLRLKMTWAHWFSRINTHGGSRRSPLTTQLALGSGTSTHFHAPFHA